ncbi:hypothetical protein [Nocardia asiatica]|uniref:hypothetical protein n=1 Tax=Nocardia asiatica TaxID=209252 RepID=UPI0002FDB194|nr:hypothetical protein [Nocardia asiatica]
MSHDPEDRCFYCMSEAEFHRASVGKERRTIFMDSPLAECPNVDPQDFEPDDSLGAVPPAAEGGRPGGADAAGPSAAPRRDVPDEGVQR